MNPKNIIAVVRSNKKIKTFFVFLLLSTVFWLFSSLSEEYIYLATYKVNYTDIPDDLLFQEAPPQFIQAEIALSGFGILGHKLQYEDLNMQVSNFDKTSGNKYSYALNERKAFLQKQLKTTRLIRFVQDSLHLNLGKLKTKKIPVQAVVKINFKSGYQLKEKIKLQPDSILVKGAERYLDSISVINTTELTLSNLSKNFSQELALALPDKVSKDISYETKTVKLTGIVAQFTQGEVILPIHAIDFPGVANVDFTPKMAKLVYQVAFEDYEKITPESFAISCTYPKTALKSSQLNLVLSKKPTFVTKYSINPQQVKYTITGQ